MYPKNAKYRFWAPLKYRFCEEHYKTQIFYAKYWTPVHTERLASLPSDMLRCTIFNKNVQNVCGGVIEALLISPGKFSIL